MNPPRANVCPVEAPAAIPVSYYSFISKSLKLHFKRICVVSVSEKINECHSNSTKCILYATSLMHLGLREEIYFPTENSFVLFSPKKTFHFEAHFCENYLRLQIHFRFSSHAFQLRRGEGENGQRSGKGICLIV